MVMNVRMRNEVDTSNISVDSVIRIALDREMQNLAAIVTEMIKNLIELNPLMPELKGECGNKSSSVCKK